MSMHLGKPAKVVVEVGDKVAIGTLIGEKDGPISANVHSSVAGVVKKSRTAWSIIGRLKWSL